jgi:predicted nucleic acid-binding protein
MIRRILDTSVAIAWYLPESFSAGAKRWQHLMLEGKAELQAPSLHYWEFANVLRTRVRRAELDAEIADEIFALHLDAPIVPAEPERETVLQIALKYETTVYDAVYLALSLQKDIPLLTAERASAPWIRKLGKLADSITR